MSAKHDRGSVLQSAWLRWALLIASLVTWLGLIRVFPTYFLRDDANMLWFAKQHTWLDCFKPTSSAALWHDGMYRPIRELAWVVQYRLFGMNAIPYQFVLGVLTVLTLANLFRLVARLSGRQSTSFVFLLVWLGAFHFLLSNVFWLSAGTHVFEMAIVSSGAYLFVVGFGSSAWKAALGALLLLMGFLSKEPAIIIGPTLVAAFLLTEGRRIAAWRWSRAAAFSLLALLFGPLYLLAFPYALLGRATIGQSSVGSLLAGAAERLAFYGACLTSGTTGVILLILAFYCIAAAAWNHWVHRYGRHSGKVANCTPVLLAAAAVAALALVRYHLYGAGLAALFAGAVLLPRRYYLFLPWAYLPIAGLCFCKPMFRSYLYEFSFAMAALASVQLSALADDMTRWWAARVTSRAVTYLAVALLVLGATGLGIAKLKSQIPLARHRSDVAMCFKVTTEKVAALPRRSTLVLVDYESLGWTPDSFLRLPDEKRFVLQMAMPRIHMPSWLRLIGRDDLGVVSLSEYRKDPRKYLGQSRVFLWLMTGAEHELFAKLDLPARQVISVKQRTESMDVLELIGRETR